MIVDARLLIGQEEPGVLFLSQSIDESSVAFLLAEVPAQHGPSMIHRRTEVANGRTSDTIHASARQQERQTAIRCARLSQAVAQLP